MKTQFLRGLINCLTNVETIAQSVENMVAKEYRLDASELVKLRQEILDTLPDFFAFKTPTSTPTQ